ncbi:MAG: methionyl-tRNA formyltransferase [Ruminococcaceae bacterium]|nr:methionyl-tRNA formyltransferase [Oscillospiraceae bacterium]
MRIVFMGTPDFSIPCLEGLIEAGHEVALVVTQADKPKGRGHKLTPPPVKECAVAHNIPVFQPEKMKDDHSFETLKNVNADLFVVVAYGKILPERILNLPEHGCINVHASLLPKYRGAAPIQWSIINGETKTGVTTMQMDVGLDTGDMLLKKEVEITDTDTGETLHDKLSLAGREVLLDTIKALEEGRLKPEKQDDADSCYAPMIHKDTAKIDFSKSAEEICCLVRGMNSYPYAHTQYEGKLMKIATAFAEKDSSLSGEAGEILTVKDEYFTVKCGSGALKITEIQMEGKRKMSVKDYVKGNNFTVGTVLK